MARMLIINIVAIFLLNFPRSLALPTTPERTSYLAECLHKLIVSENFTFPRNMRISSQPETHMSAWNFGDIIDQFLSKPFSDITFELRNNSEKSLPYAVDRRIFFVDSFRSFKDLLVRQRSHAHDFTGIHQYYYVLLVGDFSTANISNIVAEMLQLCFQKFIINVNILVGEAEIVTVYSYYPFSQINCRNTTPIVYNRFENGVLEWKRRRPFPRKLKNLWKCPLEWVTWENPLFGSRNDPKGIIGIDGLILNVLSSIMNFTLKVIISTKGRGDVFENGSMTGGFKLISEGIGDLIAGSSLCTELRMSNFACTKAYMSTSFVVALHRPKVQQGFQKLLLPFDKPSWSIIFAFLIGRWIFSQTTHNCMALRSKSLRISVCGILLSLLIVRSLYEGSVFKIHQIDMRERLPQSFEETKESGYKFFCILDNYKVINEFTNLSDRLQFFDMQALSLFKEFLKYKNKGKYAMITGQKVLALYNRNVSKLNQFHGIQRPVLDHIFCIYLPKFSFFTKELNIQIENLINVGIIDRLNDLSKHTDRKKTRHRWPLNLKSFKGPFQLLFGMLCVSGCIFVLEILSGKFQSVRRILNFFH